MISPPKPFDEIKPNLVLVTHMNGAQKSTFCDPAPKTVLCVKKNIFSLSFMLSPLKPLEEI